MFLPNILNLKKEFSSRVKYYLFINTLSGRYFNSNKKMPNIQKAEKKIQKSNSIKSVILILTLFISWLRFHGI